MSDYNKKTIAGLQEILKARGLAASGKKAELIARLTESDKAAETSDTAEPALATDSALAQEDAVEPPQEQPVAEEAITTEASGKTVEETTETAESAEAAAPEAEAKNFALHLAASDVDKEMEKRKARAERFKMTASANADAGATETATVDTDVLKNLERAKRFGTGQTAIGKLDEALPSERERGPRGKKRDAGAVDENSTMDDPGLKRNFDRKGRAGNRRRGGPGKPTAVGKPSGTKFSSDKDRQASEARKKRFAAQS